MARRKIMENEQVAPSLAYQCQPFNYEGFIIHMFSSNERTFCTNAYVIETENSLVVIDTFMVNSEAILLRQFIDNINKPLIAVIITHGHPDHYNGTHILTVGNAEIPIISTKETRDSINETFDIKKNKWKPYFGADWPETKVLPNRIIQDNEKMSLDGIVYHFKELGPAESCSDYYLTIGKQRSVIFVGDLIFNEMHAFMNDGFVRQWMKVLHLLLEEIGDVNWLFTGHGLPGKAAELIEGQINYLNFHKALFLDLSNGEKFLDGMQKSQFEKALMLKYPNHRLISFIKPGLDAVSFEYLGAALLSQDNFTR